MSRKKEIPVFELDADEQSLLESFEKGEWRSVKSLAKEKTTAKKIATNTLKKDVRINIRLASPDLTRIKQKAAMEGIPYQTLIASILHKYAAGHF
jgi:predicted DNA binding CopG/RHH family protein